MMDIASGLIFGIAYVAAPGPINVETLRQGMRSGFSASLAVQIGSSIGLAIYALLALLGAGLFLQEKIWQLLAGVSGMAVLIYLGFTTIRVGRNLVERSSGRRHGGSSRWRAFWTGAVLSLANPLDIVFWFSIGSRLFHDPGRTGQNFFVGFVLACLITSLVVALFAGYWKSRLTCKQAVAISWFCGLFLIGFGLRLGLSTSRQFIVW
jgi:chemosensory pili system protein ChpE